MLDGGIAVAGVDRRRKLTTRTKIVVQVGVLGEVPENQVLAVLMIRRVNFSSKQCLLTNLAHERYGFASATASWFKTA